jgi:glutamate-ammonia-ligase adenylyltransferase
MSAALPDPFKQDWWSAAFEELLAALTHYPSFTRLKDDIVDMQSEVSAAASNWYEKARAL